LNPRPQHRFYHDLYPSKSQTTRIYHDNHHPELKSKCG
jgi:hypothetical protein